MHSRPFSCLQGEFQGEPHPLLAVVDVYEMQVVRDL